MKVNSITNNNKINNKRTFRGYSDPGMYAFRTQFGSAREAEMFVRTVKAAKRQDAVSTNFLTAFIGKLTLAGELLGFRNLGQAAEIMKTPEHKALVKRLDRGVDAMLEATGYTNKNAINLVA